MDDQLVWEWVPDELWALVEPLIPPQRARPQGGGTVKLDGHDAEVLAVAALPDGRVVSGGNDQRVRVWDVAMRTEIVQLGCSVTALTTGPLGPDESSLVVAHEGTGFSLWSVIKTGPADSADVRG